MAATYLNKSELAAVASLLSGDQDFDARTHLAKDIVVKIREAIKAKMDRDLSGRSCDRKGDSGEKQEGSGEGDGEDPADGADLEIYITKGGGDKKDEGAGEQKGGDEKRGDDKDPDDPDDDEDPDDPDDDEDPDDWDLCMKEDGYPIFVKLPDGSTLTLNVESSDSIATVKCCVQSLRGIPRRHQRISYQSRDLEDHTTLEENGALSNSKLFLVMDIAGGGKRGREGDREGTKAG